MWYALNEWDLTLPFWLYSGWVWEGSLGKGRCPFIVQKRPLTLQGWDNHRENWLFTSCSSEQPNRFDRFGAFNYRLIVSKHAEHKMENSREQSLKIGSSQGLNANSRRADPGLPVSSHSSLQLSSVESHAPFNWVELSSRETWDWMTHVFATRTAWRYKLTALHEICWRDLHLSILLALLLLRAHKKWPVSGKPCILQFSF